MIKYLLQELEKCPNPIFSKKELLEISPEQFQELIKTKILVYRQPAEGEVEQLHHPRCQHGCALTVMEVKGEYEAVCLDHPEEDPILVVQDDLPRYVLSIETLLRMIQAANSVEGDFQKLESDSFYLGRKSFENRGVGIIFTRKLDFDSLLKLIGLQRFLREETALIVLSPVIETHEMILRNHFQEHKIAQSSLAQILNVKTYKLSLDVVVRDLLCDKLKVDKSGFEFSSDYAQVRIRGKQFDLNEMQAKIIKCLHEAAEAGETWIKQQDMKDSIFGKDTPYQRKLGEVFRKPKDREALRELIAYGRNDRLIRLNIP
jgi:hypothetical protein